MEIVPLVAPCSNPTNSGKEQRRVRESCNFEGLDEIIGKRVGERMRTPTRDGSEAEPVEHFSLSSPQHFKHFSPWSAYKGSGAGFGTAQHRKCSFRMQGHGAVELAQAEPAKVSAKAYSSMRNLRKFGANRGVEAKNTEREAKNEKSKNSVRHD